MVSNQEQQLGKYRVLRLLGRGGFADVYLGQHLYLKSYAALKVLRTSLEDEDVTQFMAEAQTLARLVHPQIVRVLDFDVIGGSPMLVMEYSPGGTLRQRHPRGQCLSLDTTVTYVKQIAAALHYAHQHDVIHRDVKPENMLVADQQVVRLSDFGIALLAPSPELLSTQEMSGTIPYMAPEQLQGKPCPASDQYALGIVAYEWLCGVRPFEGSYWQLAQQHISAPPPPLREKDPSLPQSVEAVVLKALAKDPHERYGNIQLFAQALEEAVQAQADALREAFEATIPLRAISPLTPIATVATPRKVLLSAFASDASFVARLSADVQARGITLWNAQLEAAQPESDARDRLRQAMRAVDALLIVVAPGMHSSRLVKQHLQLATLYKRPIIYLQTSSDDTIETLPLVEHFSIIDAQPERYEAALDEIVAYLERELSISSSEEEATPVAERTPRNPYKGLRAFHADDAQDFFGREALITELSDQLRAMLSSHPAASARDRLLAVVGPSGSGKSSVVMAGLLPRLAGGVLPGSDKWVYLDALVPGAHPLEALALTLAPHLPQRSITSMREDLEDDTARGLHRLSTQMVKTPEQKVILLVDQFEELFTLTSDEAERQQFIDLLVAAVAEPRGPLVVILTLRADFYDRPFAYPELGRLILGHQCGVLPMEMHELRAALRQPAGLPDVQLSFEGTLIGDLLYEVQGQAGALPLLQFTLDQLFQRRNGSLLTLSAYHEIGGVKGALAKHAEETYTQLPSEQHRRLARALFLRLIDPGLTEQDTTRRRAPLDELTLATPKATELLKQVTAYFIAARLLTTSETAGIATIEVSHEALIREWPRLSDWLWEAREDVRLQQAISEDVAEWKQRGKPGDRLYRGSQLKEAKAWAKRNPPSKQEAVFLRASAVRRVRSAGSLLAVLLLVAASLGTAGWLLTRQVPDPTLVTTVNDDGPGSLRQAITAAKPGSIIRFDPTLKGKAIVIHDSLNITKALTIRGPGAGALSISTGTNHSVHLVDVFQGNSVTISGLAFKDSIIQSGGNPNLLDGAVVNEGILTLINSTISGNDSIGISNSGTLTLQNSTVSGNKAEGIHNSGTLTLQNSTVSGNTAVDRVGGIYNEQGGMLSITNSTVSYNTGSSNGYGVSGGGPAVATVVGGIINDGTLTITNSAISHNAVSSGSLSFPFGSSMSILLIIGGGILNSNNATLTVTSSTISDNGAMSSDDARSSKVMRIVNDGGGITNWGGKLTLTNSTLSGNTTAIHGFDSRTSFNSSGGIANYGGKVDITFCTLYHNSNTGQGGGGGIFTGNGEDETGKQLSGSLYMRSSIVAGNHASSDPDIAGSLTTLGYNLVGDPSATFLGPPKVQSTDVLGVSLTNLGIDPMLRDKGGPTKTYALAPGSPAIDAIPLTSCHVNGITTDQRGIRRPDGKEGKCDIGAFEYVD